MKKTSASIPSVSTGRSTLDLLKDISERIPVTQDVLITSLSIDQETIRFSGETDTFNTVDSIKSELETSPYFDTVTISSAKLDRDGKKVQFEIRLNIKR